MKLQLVVEGVTGSKNHFVTDWVNLTGRRKKRNQFLCHLQQRNDNFLETSQKLCLKVTYWNFLVLSLLVLHAEQQTLIPKIHLLSN